jgi:hypothetical protein
MDSPDGGAKKRARGASPPPGVPKKSSAELQAESTSAAFDRKTRFNEMATRIMTIIKQSPTKLEGDKLDNLKLPQVDHYYTIVQRAALVGLLRQYARSPQVRCDGDGGGGG